MYYNTFREDFIMDNNYNNDNNQQNMSTDPYAQGGGYVQDPYNNMNGAPKPNGMAIASLVLGILSLVLCCFSLIAIILGVIGLVLGLKAKKDNPSGLATAGVVLSIIGVALAAGLWIFSLVAGESLKEWAENLQDSALFIK